MNMEVSVGTIRESVMITRKPDICWFKEAIRRQNLTQNEIARQLGITPSGLSRALSGERRFQADELATIAKVLRRDPHKVFARAGIPLSDLKPTDFELPTDPADGRGAMSMDDQRYNAAMQAYIIHLAESLRFQRTKTPEWAPETRERLAGYMDTYQRHEPESCYEGLRREVGEILEEQ